MSSLVKGSSLPLPPPPSAPAVLLAACLHCACASDTHGLGAALDQLRPETNKQHRQVRRKTYLIVLQVNCISQTLASQAKLLIQWYQPSLTCTETTKLPSRWFSFVSLHLLPSPACYQMLVFLLSLCVRDHLSALLYPQVKSHTNPEWSTS